MKKNAKAFFAILCILVVVLAGVFLLGGLRRSRLRDQPPMTLEELDRLSEALRMPEAGDEGDLAPAREGSTPTAHANHDPLSEAPRRPEPGDERPVAPAGDGSMPASGTSELITANLPRRLNRCLTDKERREFFASGTSLRNKVMYYIGTSPAGAAVDAMGVAAGIPEGSTANLGEAHLGRGNLEEARFYYTEFVRKSDNPFGLQMAYARLAWLEDDPELAARYLELGSSGPNRWAIQLCNMLALATGSIGLGEYERLVRELARE